MIRTLDILFKLPSYILHPFWIPTYGIALLIFAFFRNLPTLYIVWAIIGTFILTALIPLLISILYLRDTNDTLMMNNRESRIAPYIYTIFCYGFWCYFLHNGLNMPTCVVSTAIGASLAIALITIITLKWKISAHMTCIGGIIGSILCICSEINFISSSLIIFIFAIAIILCWSRIYMNAHSSEQLSTGFLLGLLCTYCPIYFC